MYYLVFFTVFNYKVWVKHFYWREIYYYYYYFKKIKK
jgi:hypothetical protein